MEIIVLKKCEGWQESRANNSKIAVELKQNKIKIVHAGGTKPKFNECIAAVLGSKIIRAELKEFQNDTEEYDNNKYKIDEKIKMSDARDVYMLTARKKYGIDIVDRKKLCHITAYGKLDEEILELSFREFIEISAYLGLNRKSVKELVEMSEARYCKPERIDYEFKEPSKIYF